MKFEKNCEFQLFNCENLRPKRIRPTTTKYTYVCTYVHMIRRRHHRYQHTTFLGQVTTIANTVLRVTTSALASSCLKRSDFNLQNSQSAEILTHTHTYLHKQTRAYPPIFPVKHTYRYKNDKNTLS